MRIIIGASLALMLVVAVILLWPHEDVPTLPDVGPGIHHFIDGGASD